MDGLFRCASEPVLFRAAGRLVPLRPLTLGVLASCEAYVMANRPNPADDVEEYADRLGLSAEQRDVMRWKAYDELKADKTLRFVTVSELNDWLATVEGVVHRAYWGLKDSGLKQFATPEAAEKSVTAAEPGWVAKLLKTSNMISGLDLMASMDWPDADEDERKEPGKYKPMGWRRLYRKFAEAYFWDKDTVNKLTLYDLKTYTCDEKILGGTVKVSHADLMGRFPGGVRKRR